MNSTSPHPQHDHARHGEQARFPIWWIAGAFLLVLIISLGLRFATPVLDKGLLYDEKYISAPIVNLIELGWSVDTAIDFRETKGPGLIWTYAIINEAIGHDLNSLRLTTVLFLIGGFIPLVLIASRCGMRGPDYLLLGLGYILLPYHAILGQLVMSEASFVFGSMLMMTVFVHCMSQPSRMSRILGPIIVALLMSILLHHRVHAVALAGAICLTALNRDRVRSWPWWGACLLAGLSRIPLWVHWGGLVSPEFQGPHSLGISADSLAYLGATLTPYVGVMLIYVICYRKRLAHWWVGPLGLCIGVLLSIVAMPDLTQRLPLLDHEVLRFQGIVATFVRRVAGDETIFATALVGAFMAIGLGGLGGLGAVAFNRKVDSMVGLVCRLCFWALLCGWLLYLLTGSVVYDRYPLAWAFLLPIVWTNQLPRWLMWMQYAGLLGIAGVFTFTWLL